MAHSSFFMCFLLVVTLITLSPEVKLVWSRTLVEMNNVVKSMDPDNPLCLQASINGVHCWWCTGTDQFCFRTIEQCNTNCHTKHA
ncbi:hypothetical protein AMTRI_Chr13g125090 [Amborella trichopoda]